MPNEIWYLLGILAFAVGLAVSIALHEIGHLVPAKRFGVRVTQYMIGFGPTIWSRRRGETEYGIKAIPLGGYIRMIGMFPPSRLTRPGVPAHVAEADAAAAGQGRSGTSGIFTGLIEGARAQSLEEFRPGDEKRAFYALKVWQKLVIMLGGPVMNLVLAVLLIGLVMTTYGTLQLTPRVSSVSDCVLPATATAVTECTAADPRSPAAEAGLQVGDRITAVDGVATPTWEAAQQQIRESAGRQVAIDVDRDGAPVELTTTIAQRETPVYDDRGRPVTEDGEPVTELVGFLGVSPSTEAVPQPVSAVPGEIGGLLASTVGIVANLPAHLVNVAEAAFGSEERDPEGPASVVGVARTSGEIAAYGTDLLGIGLWGKLAFFLRILGGLNLALFVFNLIPLLPLDGGHAAGALWEGVKKAWARVRSLPEPPPVDVAKALPLAYGVAVVLLAVSALLIYADLVVPISLTG